MQYSNKYIVMFTVVVCLICSVFVASAAVFLRERQEVNAQVFKQKNVLFAAKLADKGAKLTTAQVTDMFKTTVEMRVVDLATGEVVDEDPAAFDQSKNMQAAEPNPTQMVELPTKTVVYLVKEGDVISKIVLPITGKGLWSTLRGFLALDKDGKTVKGITFYEDGETPGLGGEINNPKWQTAWEGRVVFSDDNKVDIAVIKGKAGEPGVDPHHVDGLSGATLTSRGVTNTVQYWLGDKGFGPFLAKFRQEGSAQG